MGFALLGSAWASGEGKVAWTYKFSNGTSLEFTKSKGSAHPDAVYFVKKRGKAERRLIFQGQVTEVPGVGSEQSYDRAVGAHVLDLMHGQLAVFVGKKIIHVVTSDGKRVELPKKFALSTQGMEEEATASGIATGVPFSWRLVQHGARAFLLLDGDNLTAIVRDDLTIAYSPHTIGKKMDLDAIRVDDGILSSPALRRAIDLDRFDAEVAFVAREYFQVKNPEGKTADPFDIVETDFYSISNDPQFTSRAFKALDASEFTPLRKALLKKEVGSAVILGEAGSGKSKLAEAFFAGIKEGEFPEIPRTVTILQIDPAKLGSGTQYTGSMESKINALLETAKARPTLLYSDEIHSLRGQGTHSGNSNDVMQWLKPQLANGGLRMIGTSTDGEFDRSFAGDQALYQRFAKVAKSIPDKEKSLRAYEGFLTRFGMPVPSRKVLERVYELSSLYSAVDAQPRKGTRLLEDVYAQLTLDGIRRAPTIADLEASAAAFYGVSPAQFDPEKRKQLLKNLRKRLDGRVVGQDIPKDVLVDLEYQGFAGTHDALRPRVRVLFAGGKGLGKTELGLAFAEALDVPGELIEMNGYSQYSTPEDFLRVVARALRRNAFTVFILDEIEKSPPHIQNALLGVLNNGEFEVSEKAESGGNGTAKVKVDARNARFILTTNAGQSQMAKAPNPMGFGRPAANDRSGTSDSYGGDERAFRNAVVRDGISEYLLDRVQVVVPFRSYTREEYARIVQHHVDKFLAQQGAKGNRIEIPGGAARFVAWMVEETYVEGMSVREVLREMQNTLRRYYARSLIDGEAEACRLALIPSAPKP